MYIYRGKLDLSINPSQMADNEGITIMFPTSGFHLGDPVYTCGQWSKSGNETNVLCWRTGTIDSVTVFGTTRQIGYYYDNNDYRFNATFSDDIRKISLAVEGKNISANARDIHLVYPSDDDSNLSVEPNFVVPHIYIGKLTGWAPYAVDEQQLVIIPGGISEGNTACAFFQWAVTDTGEKKVNRNSMGKIMNIKNVDGGSVSFTFSDNYYTFNAAVDERREKLTLTMRNANDDSTSNTLDLAAIVQPKRGREPRALLSNSTTTVVNNTQEIIVCSMTTSGASGTDQFLAIMSLILGTAGLALAFPAVAAAAFPVGAVAVGKWLAGAGLAVAAGGMGQMYTSTGEQTSAAMFPGDTVVRTSSNSVFNLHSHNDIDVALIRVDSGTRLVISAATAESVGTEVVNLSDYIPGGKRALKYKELFTINLPSSMRLKAFRYVVIPRLDTAPIANLEKSLSTMQDSDIPNALSTSRGSVQSWYGTLDDYYATVAKKGRPDGYTLFETSDRAGLTFSQPISGEGGGKHAAVVIVQRNGVKCTLLRLSNCKVQYAHRRIRLNDCSTEDAVKTQIETRFGDYDGYIWSETSKEFFEYRNGSASAIIFSSDPKDYVYIVAKLSNPVLNLVYASNVHS